MLLETKTHPELSQTCKTELFTNILFSQKGPSYMIDWALNMLPLRKMKIEWFDVARGLPFQSDFVTQSLRFKSCEVIISSDLRSCSYKKFAPQTFKYSSFLSIVMYKKNFIESSSQVSLSAVWMQV